MQRGRATVTKGRGSTSSSQRGRSSSFDGVRRTGSADALAISSEGAEPTVQQLLNLQRDAGNEAVTSLVTSFGPVQRDSATMVAAGSAGPAAPPVRTGPSDINLGFNALDIAHRLIEAIDQKQIKQLTKSDPGYVEGVRPFARQIDFKVVHDQLSGLTANQVKQVEARYEEFVHRALYIDLFRGGESGHRPNLSFEQEVRLKALLAGTRAEEGEDPEVAAQHQREADAYELRGILKGKPKGADIERVMALLRRTPEEIEKLIRTYEGGWNWDLQLDLMHMPIPAIERALMLLEGKIVAADAHAIVQRRKRIVEIDAKILELDPPGVTVTDVLSFGAALGGGGGGVAINKATIASLKAERKQHVDAIEERVKLTAEEARGEAEATSSDVLDIDAAVTARVTQVLGGDDATEQAIGGTQGKLINAIKRADPSETAAAEMRKLDERGELTTDVMAQMFRNLRRQAEMEAQRLYPDVDADELAEETRKLSDRWFIHLRSTWDASVVGQGRTFDQLLDKGSQGDVDFKRTLYMESGKLSEVDELVLALRGDRKDLETVKRILRDKNYDQLMELQRLYKIKTTTPQNKWGGSLQEDLLGFAPTSAGQKDTTRSDDPKGKAQGSERLLIEDYLKRPWREGGKEEVDYIVGRAEREYDYTIANRGKTGWWRDHWGNEAKSLLDATLKEVREKRDKYYAMTAGGTDRKAMRTRDAKLLIQAMHFARATIRGDRAGYEKATAELRATFQAIASFVLQAVLTAVLTPAAAALFRGIAAATRYGIWLRNTVVSISSTIAANKSVYGNEYSREMLFADLRGGLSGAIGSAAVGRLVDPIAGRLQARLGKEMAGEFIEGVKNYGGMTATSALEGNGLVAFDEFAKEHFLGKVGEGVTHVTSRGLGHLGYGSGPTHAPYDPDAPAKGTRTGAGGAPPGGPEAGRVPGTDQQPADVDVDVDTDADFVPPPTPMALPPELNKPARRTKTPATEPAPSPKEGSVSGVDEPKKSVTKPAEETAEPDDSPLDTNETDITPERERQMLRDAEMTRREQAHPLDEASIRSSTGPTRQTRALAGEFAPLFERFKTVKEVVQRNHAIYEIIHAQLEAAGVYEVRVMPGEPSPGARAEFNFETWEITLSARDLAVPDMTIQQFSALIESATHEARHALHHWRGLRAALESGQFRPDSALKPNAEAVEAARVANGSDDPRHAYPSVYAKDEGLDVYQQTFGKDKEVERGRIRRNLDARRAELLTAQEAAQNLPEGSTRRQAADLAAESARKRFQEAFNQYIKTPQETDAYRRGFAMQAAMLEALLLPRIEAARKAARQAHKEQVDARRTGDKDAMKEALDRHNVATDEAKRLQDELEALPHRTGDKTTLEQDLAFADEVRRMAMADRERAMAKKDQDAVAEADRRIGQAVREMREIKAEMARRKKP